MAHGPPSLFVGADTSSINPRHTTTHQIRDLTRYSPYS
ncbi:hypothetical protein D039_1834 [Vibrio parahaemolyticus EKP-028]|nr:hypothetical protein D039_1834 [Vibrio parahaemolyticus EKP-028]